MSVMSFIVDLGPLAGDQTATIEYTYTPRIPGRYSGPPEDCYPDEGEELEVTKVVIGNCDMTTLLAAELETDEQFLGACRDEYHDMITEMQLFRAGI